MVIEMMPLNVLIQILGSAGIAIGVIVISTVSALGYRPIGGKRVLPANDTSNRPTVEWVRER